MLHDTTRARARTRSPRTLVFSRAVNAEDAFLTRLYFLIRGLISSFAALVRRFAPSSPGTETLSPAPEASAMRVFRVSHSFVAAASRRHARRRPRRAPARVSAAMDPDPVTNLRVGYRRNEMWSESLVGTV